MAKSPISKSNPHHFLCCFGFSPKFRRFKPLKPAASHKNRPFSAEIKRFNPDSDRLALRFVAPADEDFPAATSQPGDQERPEKVKKDIVEEKIIFVQNSNLPKKPADQSQSRFSLTRKLESFRSFRFTQPTSPSLKKNQKPTAISHSLSFPPPNPPPQYEPGQGTIGSNRVGLNDVDTSKTYGPAAGMSIMIMTLAIMVLWGKLCAIFCTAMWILIVTSLRSIVEDDDAIDFIEPGSYSQGFKRKLVVLKGFLYKNQREKLLKKL